MVSIDFDDECQRGEIHPPYSAENSTERGGKIMILVDTDTSRENVSRAAASQGWEVKALDSDGTGYRITIAKG